MSKKFTARCKFTGRFPDSKTNVEFTSAIPDVAAGIIAAPLVSSFRRIMKNEWPDNPPALRKLTITINFP